MIISITEIGLQQIMIHILGGKLGFDPRYPHSFKLQHHHRTGGILGQGLIDLQTDFFTCFHPTANQMGFDQFLGYVSSHLANSPVLKVKVSGLGPMRPARFLCSGVRCQ